MGDLSREQALPSIDLGAWLPTDADMAMDLGGLFDNNLDDSYVQSYLSSLPQPGELGPDLNDPLMIPVVPGVPMTEGDNSFRTVTQTGSGHSDTTSATQLPPEGGPAKRRASDAALEDSGAAEARQQAGGGRTSVQRQQNNRRAQQRYREKRKAQHAELEEQVQVLSEKLGTLQDVQSQAAALGGENAGLRAQLQQQTETIEKLQANVKQLLVTSKSMEHEAAAAAAQTQPSTAAPTPPDPQASLEQQQQQQGPLPFLMPSKPDTEETLAQMQGLVDQMRDVLVAANLPTDRVLPGDPRYDDSLQQSIARLVAGVSMQTLCVLSKKSNCPKDKCKTDPLHSLHRFANVIDCTVYKATWTGWLQNIHLTESQEDSLLEMRANLLECLRKVYAERQRINLIAMGMMLPRVGPDCDPSVEGKIKSIGSHRALCSMQAGKALDDTLDSLKLNLKAEQKVLVEIQYNFIHRVMRPVQAAVLILNAFPWNIEALAVANLLAYQRGLVPDDKHSEAGATLSGASAHTSDDYGTANIPSVALAVLGPSL